MQKQERKRYAHIDAYRKLLSVAMQKASNERPIIARTLHKH